MDHLMEENNDNNIFKRASSHKVYSFTARYIKSIIYFVTAGLHWPTKVSP